MIAAADFDEAYQTKPCNTEPPVCKAPECFIACLLYTSPSPRDQRGSRMPSSA